MNELTRLRAEHAEIQTLIGKLRYLIGLASPPPQLHLFVLRHELSATLIGHLETEDGLLYPSLLASPDADVAATARAFREEMGGLAAAYVEYCKKWTAKAIGANWPGYCDDSSSLIAALNKRIAREHREVYPLLEQHGGTASGGSLAPTTIAPALVS